MAVIEYDSYKQKLLAMDETFENLFKALEIEQARQELNRLELEAHEDGFWNDLERSQKNQMRSKQLHNKIHRYEKLVSTRDDLLALIDMGTEMDDASLLPELEEGYKKLEADVEQARLTTLLSGEYDNCNAILTFHAGAGGTEAQDWTEMLYRMYMQWANKHGFEFEMLDYLDGDEAGLKSATVMVKGENAYGYLKGENGVHRLVRVSPFDANARRQTSFAALEVMPELPDDIEVEIRPEDIEMQVYRASGAGGQQDFVLGAYLSKGGKSFICLSSTHADKDGTLHSRIRPTLQNGSVVTDTRVNTMYVVTEYGCVCLKGLTVWERAEKLISIAHPDFREELIREAEKQKIWYPHNRR